ncbi:YggT family protein [Psychrobacillus sp. FSL K6-2365]|jgi:YggT family protein|uniref:YggT family protein n=1 Tax=Psychrobacillus TaxID=1221880 RepID=UPI0008E8BDBD|nr:YggT family protein [Psychrobacillus psychrodurans]MCZ8539458.1 YggT family protein [Psychrobacillus psychrodurans]SFM39343.1 YggT family protein [Psychrobacillus psychrodurans]
MGLVLSLISWGVQIYTYALIAYILMSWVPSIQQSGFGKFLGKICEPYLEPFRKIIPPLGMIDISPIVAIFVLNLAMTGIYYIANIVV